MPVLDGEQQQIALIILQAEMFHLPVDQFNQCSAKIFPMTNPQEP